MMDGKIREKAKIAMRGILQAAGYEVEEVDPPLDLSAMRDGECLLIMCSNTLPEIAEFDRTNYSLRVENQDLACNKLLFTLDDSVSGQNSIVWGVKEFVRYAGEAALARVLDRQLSLSFAGTSERVAGNVTATAVPEINGIEPVESSGITLMHLPIKVNRQAAEKIAGVQGTPNLRFMPHWVYHYVSSGEQVYKDRRIPFDSEGDGAINSINGLKVEGNAKSAVEAEIPAGSDVVQPHISREDATERIYNELIEQLTQHVRIKQEKGDAIFYEEKVIKPDRKNINLEIQQVYVPIWQIRGKKIVEINGFTGEILSEPMDEGVEIL
jgi:hypothetical protein